MLEGFTAHLIITNFTERIQLHHMIKAKQGKVAWFLSKECTVRFVDLIPDFTHYYCT
jgi:hypothetical protein